MAFFEEYVKKLYFVYIQGQHVRRFPDVIHRGFPRHNPQVRSQNQKEECPNFPLSIFFKDVRIFEFDKGEEIQSDMF